MQDKMKDIAISELQRRIAIYDDEFAYKELFFQLYSRLCRFSRGFLKSNELAEEVVADVFLEIWHRRHKLMEIESLHTYIYICVKNLSLKKLNDLNKNSLVSIDSFSIDFISTYSTPEEAVLSSEMFQRIQLVVNSLPPRCKLIYKLAKEDKLQYKEIADILNISIKTIDNQLSTAIKRIASTINFKLEREKSK